MSGLFWKFRNGLFADAPDSRLPVAQLNPIQQPLMAVGIVPKAAAHHRRMVVRCPPKRTWQRFVNGTHRGRYRWRMEKSNSSANC